MKIYFHIFYSAHETAEDFRKLDQVFREADVYIPESLIWDDGYFEDLNRLSREKITPRQMIRKYFLKENSSWGREFRLIYGSGKLILAADIPFGHRLIREYERADDLYAESVYLFRKGYFDSALEIINKHIELNAHFLLKRDKKIKRNLKGPVTEKVKKTPRFKNKEEVKVLVGLGSFHTLVYHDLKKAKLQVSWQFVNDPDVLSRLEEAEKIKVFLKDRKIDDIFFARVMIEELLDDYLRGITDDSNKLAMICRKIASKLNLKEIMEISKELGEDGRRTIATRLKKRGIKVPETEREMDKMLRPNK